MNYIIKLTDGCNMRCRYCCIGDKSKFNIITSEQMYLNLKFCAENSVSRKDSFVNVIFHGGEPSIIPSQYYKENIERIQKEYSNIKFRWSIQTNGLNISEELKKIFLKYDFHVGVSLDGTEKNHDRTRIDTAGNPTYKRIFVNITDMKEKGIPVSVLMVVGANTDYDFSYLDILDKHKIAIKINPMIECGEAETNKDILLSSGQYADYIIKAFEYSVKKNLDIPIEPIDGLYAGIINKNAKSECTFSENCFCNFLAVNHCGDIYPCGRFCDSHEFLLGNVNQNIYDFPLKNSMHKSEFSDDCKNCQFKALCNGGCPFISWTNHSKKNPLCSDYKKLFRYFMTDGLSKVEEVLKKKRKELIDESVR